MTAIRAVCSCWDHAYDDCAAGVSASRGVQLDALEARLAEVERERAEEWGRADRAEARVADLERENRELKARHG